MAAFELRCQPPCWLISLSRLSLPLTQNLHRLRQQRPRRHLRQGSRGRRSESLVLLGGFVGNMGLGGRQRTDTAPLNSASWYAPLRRRYTTIHGHM